MPALEDVLKLMLPTVERLPRKVRSALASELKNLFYDSRANPSDTRVALLPKLVLGMPARGGRKHASLAQIIFSRLARWRAGQFDDLFKEACKVASRLASKTRADSAARAKRLLAMGFASKAVRALDAARVLEATPKVIRQLKEKHPDAPPPTELPEATASPHVTTESTRKAIHAFHRGSAPGPTGLRAEHLQDCLAAASFGTAEAMLYEIAEWVNMVAQGNGTADLHSWLAAARLIPLAKTDDGVRPIAIGEVLRRIVGKCLCQSAAPLQKRSSRYSK